MAFRFLLGLIFAACLWVGHAQAVPDQVVTGYMTTSGCPSVALTPCFVQYGAGGASTVTIGAPLGVQTAAASVAVVCNSGCSGGPADESTFTAGTTGITTGGFFQTTATSNPLTNGQAGSVQMTANRAFMVNLRNAAGAESGVAAVPLQVSLANTAANGTAVAVSNASLPLPAGAATSANQSTANSSLATIATNTGAPIPPMSTTSSCTALCSNLVLENTASHNLYSFEISADSTLSAAPWYAIIYNATSLPANGAVTPAKCFGPFPINTTVFTQGFTSPIPFATGITIGVSTTGCFTQTASVHAFISGDAQ